MGVVMKAAQAKLAGKTVDGKAAQRQSKGEAAMTPAKTPAVRSRQRPDEGVHLAGRAAGSGDDRRTRLGQRLSGIARRANHRGHLSRGGDRHGGAARLGRGTILEENIARTAGSIGEGVAAGAVFTLPAFVMAKAWPSFGFADAYWKSTALILVGSVLGVLFVSLVRRVLVEDPELPFPESLAASQIHKAGQVGAQAAKYLFYNMAFGAATFLLGAFNLFAPDKDFFFKWASWIAARLRSAARDPTQVLTTGGISTCLGAHREPGVFRRGIRHRARTRVAQFLRQRDRVGTC